MTTETLEQKLREDIITLCGWAKPYEPRSAEAAKSWARLDVSSDSDLQEYYLKKMAAAFESVAKEEFGCVELLNGAINGFGNYIQFAKERGQLESSRTASQAIICNNSSIMSNYFCNLEEYYRHHLNADFEEKDEPLDGQYLDIVGYLNTRFLLKQDMRQELDLIDPRILAQDRDTLPTFRELAVEYTVKSYERWNKISGELTLNENNLSADQAEYLRDVRGRAIYIHKLLAKIGEINRVTKPLWKD